ncbi:hypothetical protein ONZ45_g2458 [Pleurotus djamor]|nr:hypothetical protein ONZ45_g2458 [Pleurotus djamor]
MSELTFQSKRKLLDGNEIPILGFGTYELDGKDAYNCVLWALEAGYRHVDSAEWYENEKECGQAILDFCRRSGTPRADIFYTTKLKMNNGYEHTKTAIKNALDQCGLGYIDLYLIHGPLGGKEARLQAWKAISEAREEGILKSIGVSCFGVRHLTEIAESGLPLPAVNQGFIPLPKSVTKARIIANTKLFDFELSPDDMLQLDGLNENLVTDWDPSECP